MTPNELAQELATEGLRLATDDEAGWYYSYTDASGERVTVWVTDLN